MNHKILTSYLVKTFLISWTFFGIAVFIPATFQMIPLFLGVFGPMAAALITMKIHGGAEEKSRFKRELLKWKVSPLWFLFPLAFVMAMQILDGAGQIGVGSFAINPEGIKKLYMAVPMILLMIIGGGQEEIGWRGLLLPELLRKLPPVAASLVTGLTWALWHIPLFFIEGMPQHGQNFLSFTLGCISLSLFMTYLYGKTGSTLISGYWFHMVANGLTGFFNVYLLREITSYVEWPYYLLSGILILSGILLLRGSPEWKALKISLPSQSPPVLQE